MTKLFDVIIRILGFPFFAALSFIGCIFLWVKYLINYSRFGGEAIAYTNKTQRKCINDVFVKVQELVKNESNLQYPQPGDVPKV